MKKIVALVLVLVLVFALCACGGSKGPSGTYKLTGIKIDGKDYSSYINSMGYGDTVITFNSDKTGTMTGSNTNIKFTWNENSITDKSGTYSYTFSGGKVVLILKNVELTFSK